MCYNQSKIIDAILHTQHIQTLRKILIEYPFQRIEVKKHQKKPFLFLNFVLFKELINFVFARVPSFDEVKY